MEKVLTKVQERIVDFVSDEVNERGFPPTFREIAKRCGITSIGSVHYHLDILREHGFIEREDNSSRSIRPTAKAVGIPIIGRVIAGVPVTAHQNIEGYVEPASLMIGKKGMFALRVHGDSMIDAGIFEGDIAVVHEQQTANNKEIVVAMIDDEATIKYFYRDSDHIRLEPANERYKPIISRNVKIIGKVVKIIRNY